MALLATQIVAGTNYCILCKVTPTTPDAKTQYQLLYIYEDLNGIAEITGRKTLIGGEALPGGFEANAGDPSIYDNSNSAVKSAFNKTVENICGVDYEPVAYLGNQVVAGTNYLVLCRTYVVIPDAEPKFELVTIYEDLAGNTDLNNVAPVNCGETDEPGEPADPGTGMPNPWADYKSVKKAAKAAGLTSFAAPARLGGKKICLLQAKKGIVEVGYGSKSENISFRKGTGTEDISGDHNEYTKVAEVKINGQTVIMRGAKSKVYSMIWCDGMDSYSFFVKSGVSAKTAKKLAAALIAENS